MKATSLIFVIIFSSRASAAALWALPDPLVTPGAVNPAVTLEALCLRSASDAKRPSPPSWMMEFELSSYNIPAGHTADYVMNYLIPLSLGGANTISNVWPQPRAEAERKAALEARMLARVCTAYEQRRPEAAAEILTNVQRYVAEDWTAAYADYVGP